MMTIGYHASHEQFAPADLLGWVRLAEEVGFGAAMCSDHFAPWSESQGHSAFAWSWLGAALEATSLSFGTVTAPGYRYHPAIVAQAAATLASMYQDRLWLALGSGEAMNERMTGLPWPIKAERQERLGECVEIIRALWAGETVTHHGRVTVEEAKLWTRPERPPLLVGAALSEKTAAWCASWADALITINAPRERLVAIIDAFQSHGGADKPLFLQSHVSWASTEDEARAQAMEQWRTPVLPAPIGQDLRTPSQFDEMARFIGESDVASAVRISSDPGQHLAWLKEDRELGFSRVYLHNVGANQQAFIETFGASVLPQLA
jgi:probable non-F420 flavinoid oxidoreductase